MSSVTFDTLKLVDALEKAQMPRDQARAIVDVVREARDASDVATKGDLRELRMELKGDIRLLQWMLGILIAGVASLMLKAFS